MQVTVLLFAALRAHAGTARLTTAPGSVGTIRARLADEYGPAFAAALARSRALVDGEPVDDATEVAAGAELAFLPPFAGGSHASPWRSSHG